MSEAKHTPGPWTWGDRFHGLFSPNGEVMDFDRYDGMWLSFENQKANAALIAAAPDLLGALKNLQNWCVGYEDSVLNPTARRWIDEADQAIAKAEGR